MKGYGSKDSSMGGMGGKKTKAMPAKPCGHGAMGGKGGKKTKVMPATPA